MRWVALGGLCLLLTACGGTAARQSAAPPAGATVAAPAAGAGRRARFAQAHQAVAEKRYADAIPVLDALCPVYPELQDYCLYDLALSHARTGDDDAAEALWARLAATQPQSLFAARAALDRATLLQARGDRAAARALLDGARASDDDDVALRALLELAALDDADGNPAAAQADLMTVRTRAPGTALGTEAKQRVENLRRRDPGLAPQGADLDAELRLLLAERDFAAAQGVADRLLAAAPAADRPELLRLRADAELGGGQFDQGLATLQEIVRQYPDAPAAPEAQLRAATLLWNRDRDQEATQIFLDFRRRHPDHPRTPEVLYALGRIAQGEGQTDAAVAAYAHLADAYPASPPAREARWRIGWIRYQQGRWQDAAAAFDRAAAGADGGASAEARYWQARALAHAGERAGAERLYRAIVADAPASYYALWAEQRLGLPAARPHGVAAPPQPRGIGAAPPGADPYHWVRANELQSADLRPLARAELRAFERSNADQPGATPSILAAYPAVDGYRDAIRLANAHGMTDPNIFFPLAFWPQIARHSGAGVDPLLVLALMRQESFFDPAARSSANAQGLMQLLPSTAERVARRLGRPPPATLYDPDTNIALGVAHLQQLLQAYQGDPLKALAAYNGGEEAVAKWQRRFATLEPDEFVESITYRETRDYVKRVMGNYRRYQQTYAGLPSN
jgi:soluble lytic murein transglycosylase